MATVVKTETQHKGEFLMSEANGDRSREAGILKTGQIVRDGALLAFDGTGDLVLFTGALDSGDLENVDNIAGFAYGAKDTSATGVNADFPGYPYIARDAVVKDSAISLHTVDAEDTDVDAIKAALAAKGLIIRPAV